MISSPTLTVQAHLPKQGEHEPGAPLRLVRFLKLIEQINARSPEHQCSAGPEPDQSFEALPQEESPKPSPKRGEL